MYMICRYTAYSMDAISPDVLGGHKFMIITYEGEAQTAVQRVDEYFEYEVPLFEKQLKIGDRTGYAAYYYAINLDNGAVMHSKCAKNNIPPKKKTVVNPEPEQYLENKFATKVVL